VLETSNTSIVDTQKQTNNTIAGVEAKVAQLHKTVQDLSRNQKLHYKTISEKLTLITNAIKTLTAKATTSGVTQASVDKLVASHEQGKDAALDKVCSLASDYLKNIQEGGSAAIQNALDDSCSKWDSALAAVADDMNEAIAGLKPPKSSTPFGGKRKGVHQGSDAKRASKAKAETQVARKELDELARKVRKALTNKGVQDREAESVANKVAEMLGRSGEIWYIGFNQMLTKQGIQSEGARAKIASTTAEVVGDKRFRYNSS
jgi:hypothetical protein